MGDPKADTVLSLLQLKLQGEAECFYAGADLGAALFAVVEEIGLVNLPAWIEELRPRAIERGIRTPLSLDNAQRCIRTERFRRAAGARFKKIVERGNSYVRPIISLPEPDIDDLVGNGIPTETGRVAVEEATVQQIKEAAKAVRRRNGTPGPTAKRPKSHFDIAMEHLRQAGALTDEQVRQLQAVTAAQGTSPAPAATPGDVPRTEAVVDPPLHPAAPRSGDVPWPVPIAPTPMASTSVATRRRAPLVASLTATPKKKGRRGRGRVA